MSISALPVQHPLDAALELIEQALDSTADTALWSLSDDQLTDLLIRREALSARCAELGLRMVREADARDVGSRAAAPSTAAWLRERLRLTRGEANSRVRLAAALGGELTATGAALAAGSISAEHAAVIARSIDRLPAALPAATCGDAEAFLLDQAATFDPDQLRQLGRHLRDVVDPDAAERDEKAAARRRELALTGNGDGTHTLRGTLDNETAEKMMAALDPLAAPRPAADGTPDPRTGKQRLADALADLLDRYLGLGDLPARRGARPHVHITAGLDTLLNLPGAPAAHTAWGGPVTAETLRRTACDADITRVLLDPAGVPLDVGRAHRTVTPGLWAALIARDRGCVFPHCTRPGGWTEAHHIRHWIDLGPTALHNLALLCGFHHRTVHHKGWEIRIGDDGHPELIPPRWIDTGRAPRRNTHWRIRDRLPPPDGP